MEKSRAFEIMKSICAIQNISIQEGEKKNFYSMNFNNKIYTLVHKNKNLALNESMSVKIEEDAFNYYKTINNLMIGYTINYFDTSIDKNRFFILLIDINTLQRYRDDKFINSIYKAENTKNTIIKLTVADINILKSAALYFCDFNLIS